MSEDDMCKMDQELAEFECPAEEVKHMSYKEKKELISTFHLSMCQSSGSNQEKPASQPRTTTSPIDELQLRLQRAGVSMTPRGNILNVEDDSDEIVVIKELERPHASSLRRPSIRSTPPSKSTSPAGGNFRATPTSRVTPTPTAPVTRVTNTPTPMRVATTPTTPLSRVTPARSTNSKVTHTVTSGTFVRAKKKIELSESVKEQEVDDVNIEDVKKREVIPPLDYVKNRAEIYALNPHSFKDRELSTLAEMSPLPKKKNVSVPFYYSEHALSLNPEDYTALFLRKFGFGSVSSEPVKSDKVEETVQGTQNFNESASAQSKHLDCPLFDELASNPKYNLRQRATTKRSANDFEFNISDDEDSDSIIPNKKLYRNEKDNFNLQREDAKIQPPKSRAGRLSLSTTKIAAECNAKPCNELVTVDSDNSSDSDIPGKEVCVPKLLYSSVAGNNTSKWKTSKTKVSAVPKGQDDIAEALEAMNEFQTVKPRPSRSKPTETIKPRPISGKHRRAALFEGSRKSSKNKQANKKDSDSDDGDEQEQQLQELFPCPLCREEFSQDEIEAHVNACCDQTASQSLQGECPVCSKKFPVEELPEHSSMCEETSENLAMDVN